MSFDPEISIDPSRRRARGVVSNHTGRFEKHQRTEIDDGWDHEEERGAFRTSVVYERSKSLINYIKSPDLSFDRSINPYRGCEHGCVYCFARPTHAYLGYSPGLDFETRLIAKENAPELLEKELRNYRYAVAPIAIGTNTDPYQAIEKERKLVRECLQVLRAFKHPVAIVTKGTLIERDIDILSEMARDNLVRVGVSVTSLDVRTSRLMEPRAPTPARRLAMIEKLSNAGIPVRLMVSPVVPGVTDHEIERILGAGASAGARAASWVMLRLPLEVSELFQEWLAAHFPDRQNKVMSLIREMHGGKDYDPEWGKRMRGEGVYAQMIAHRIAITMKRLGLPAELPELNCDLFERPIAQGDQLSLF